MNTYAIIETGGKQIRVEPGRYVQVEKLEGNEGDTVEFGRVLLHSVDGDVKLGNPVLEGVKVVGKIRRQGRGRKIIVYKMRPKKHYRRKKGHRQSFTQVMIDAIQS